MAQKEVNLTLNLGDLFWDLGYLFICVNICLNNYGTHAQYFNLALSLGGLNIIGFICPFQCYNNKQ